MRRYVACLLLLLASLPSIAQIVSNRNYRSLTDSVRAEYDRGPYFTLYKDNYFLVGCPVGKKITRENSDVKFQISISQKLTRSTLPWNTYLYLTFTQKVFWNVFENSLPMRDFIFNPGIGLAKPLFSKGKYIGKVSLMLEHESNGRDGDLSRSWNRVTLGANIIIDEWLMVHGKVWVPIIDSINNKDILDYGGIWQNGVTMSTPNKRFSWDITLVKRRGWNLSFNTIVGFCWRPWKQSNQYLYLQYYNGYCEDLVNYNKFTSMLRVGICIKPPLFSEF